MSWDGFNPADEVTSIITMTITSLHPQQSYNRGADAVVGNLVRTRYCLPPPPISPNTATRPSHTIQGMFFYQRQPLHQITNASYLSSSLKTLTIAESLQRETTIQ